MRGPVKTGALLLAVVAAADAGADEARRLANETEISVVDASGNTDVTSVHVKNALKYAFSPRLSGEWRVGALYGETGGERSAESYATEVRLERRLTGRVFAAARAGWQRDEFAGIEARYEAGPTVGYRALAGPVHELAAEAGLDYVAEEYTDATDADRAEGRALLRYEYRFRGEDRLSQRLVIRQDLGDGGNYGVASETALTVALGGSLALKTGYEVRYDHEPVPAGLGTTDRTLSLSLVVRY